MEDKLYIGIDSGTQSTKGVVLSVKHSGIIATASARYSMAENDRGGREQDPSSWTHALTQVIRELVADTRVEAQAIKAIGISGQQHGFVPLDKHGQVLRPAKLWCDTETVAEAARITSQLGGDAAAISLTGNAVAVGFTASKVLWLKEHEPQNYRRLHTILLPHDYLNYYLTGRFACEYGDASGTAYFDVKNRCWSDTVLHAIDDERDLRVCLPPFIDADELHGLVESERAAELGLPSGVLVSSGGGDNMMAAIGTGNVTEGIVTVSLGTSGTIFACSTRPIIDPAGELASFCSSTGNWLPLVCTMNVTAATEMVRSFLALDLDEMNRRASQVPPGSNGLVLVPYFNGERTPPRPDATAVLAGITSTNLESSSLARAVFEGTTFGLRYGLEVLRRLSIEPRTIRLTGGGARSALWRQMVADIFNLPVISLPFEETAAVGAALQAWWCDERQQSTTRISLGEIVQRVVCIDEEQVLHPQPITVSRYEDHYRRYLAMEPHALPRPLTISPHFS